MYLRSLQYKPRLGFISFLPKECISLGGMLDSLRSMIQSEERGYSMKCMRTGRGEGERDCNWRC
jgi:hypothetical protein